MEYNDQAIYADLKTGYPESVGQGGATSFQGVNKIRRTKDE